jgi:2-polyprenyl-3-methyl-5-hydroxy-6-metoxy-1,4-benzoquinol methylase
LEGALMTKPLQWTRDLVAEFWNGISHTRLLRELSFSALAGEACLQVFSPFLEKSNKYLDFGGGDGHFASILCSHGFRVATYDPSLGRTEESEHLLSTHGENHLGNIGPETDIKFDGIFMLEVAEHILDEDIGQTYELIRSLLKPGGLLFVTTPNKEDLELSYAYEPQSGAFFHRWQHVRSFDRAKLAAMLKPFGLHEALIHEIEFRKEVFEAMNQSVAHAGLDNPFATMRPVIMGARTNLAAVFCNQEATIVVDKDPYIVSIKIIAELPPDAGFGSDVEGPVIGLPAGIIRQDTGSCFLCPLEIVAASDDSDHPYASLVRLFEDSNPLGPPHAPHEEIRRLGSGAYSHWEGHLFFSTSDGSDPRSNGRVYEIRMAAPRKQKNTEAK